MRASTQLSKAAQRRRTEARGRNVDPRPRDRAPPGLAARRCVQVGRVNAPAPILATLPAKINAEHEAAFGKAREALEHARRAGELLLEAKAALKHGEWLPWVRSNCDFSERTAAAYMRLSREWSTLKLKSATAVADLPLRDALQLLAEPQEKSLTTPKPEAPVEQVDQVHAPDVHQHQPGGGADTSGQVAIADIKVMPLRYWRAHPEAQPQLLAQLLDSWDESSDATRREFFLILNGRSEFMLVINSMVKAAA